MSEAPPTLYWTTPNIAPSNDPANLTSHLANIPQAFSQPPIVHGIQGINSPATKTQHQQTVTPESSMVTVHPDVPQGEVLRPEDPFLSEVSDIIMLLNSIDGRMKVLEEQIQQSWDAIIDLKFSAEHLQAAILTETRSLRSSSTKSSHNGPTLSGISLFFAAIIVLALIAVKRFSLNEVFR